MNINKLDFLDDLLLKEQMSMIYSRVTNAFSSTLLVEDSLQKIGEKDIFIIKDVPGYLHTRIHPSHKVKKASMYHGYSINLGKYENFEAYLVKRLSSKRRSNHRAFKKRLELCFSVQYKMYFGPMEKKEYDYLFDQLRLMIKRRFTLKQMKHSGWEKMDNYHKIIYPKILEKKASIFAIYHDSKPISISINLIEEDIYSGFMMAFDVDFSKFYPGFINIQKQVEWCFENKFQLFDMMKGDLAYKNIFADEIYYYQCQIVFPSKKQISSIVAKFLALKVELYYNSLHLLKKLNLHLVYRRLKISIYGLLNKKVLANVQQEFRVKNIPNINSISKLVKISIEDDSYTYLRKPIYDFMYTSFENINDIEVFESVAGISYLVKGKKNNILINSNP